MTLNSILQVDADLSARMRVAEEPGLPRRLAVFLGHTGDSWFWLAGLLAIWVLGDLAWRGRSQALIIGIIITAVLVMAMKFTIRRQRPEGELGQIYRRTDPHSFPSGHAARAMMLAVMAVGLGPAWFGITLAIWAPLVGIARVAMGVHYLSDILAGWLIGAVMGIILLQFLG
ncbi:MAG: phosphatase PAP2 family protein [Chloroflexi bacterium]|nr:MAG: phosphatase PAP2 family protein [Chloroflexota bacterium]MBL1195726.1 phosphatase PAP2 family protein [Chloroflexota bacterium]NOH13014.1 phosphatase PAP2 family protein [Chloroflexota bacterium]